MPLLDQSSIISERLSDEPELGYLDGYLRNTRMGNDACKSQQALVKDSVILKRINKEWHNCDCRVDSEPWKEAEPAEFYAIVMNYLDPETVRAITMGLGIDARVLRAHIDGCEQHYTGTWKPSVFTFPPYLVADQRQSNFVSFDYRRRYSIASAGDFAAFNFSRKERCTFLRSHHSARAVNALFEHERCTIAWSPASSDRPWGALLVLCDPGIGSVNKDAMLRRVETSIRMLSPDQQLDKTIIHAMTGLIREVTALWNEVTFHANIQVSALEDQLEHDFWDKPRNPVEILHETQRLSRNLTRYRDQVLSMESDLAFSSGNQTAEGMAANLNEIKARLDTSIKRTDRAVPALLATIAINEGCKASSLTAVALWFAPLSLSISIVSIDGRSTFGGMKYWIWACIAFPLLFLVILIANSSDKFIDWLGRRRRGRALMSLFKPETRI